MTRVSHEAFALDPFHAMTIAASRECTRGQGSLNRIPIVGAVYYQFGDLRVELPNRTLVVEVESSGGGTTNLAKYWEAYESRRIVKPMRLLHLFQRKSENDYEAHFVVWRFVYEKMRHAIGDSIQASIQGYRSDDLTTLRPALDLFSAWLDTDI